MNFIFIMANMLIVFSELSMLILRGKPVYWRANMHSITCLMKLFCSAIVVANFKSITDPVIVIFFVAVSITSILRITREIGRRRYARYRPY